MAASKDYYQILGIARSASTFEINNAYRRLALKHHPDNDGSEQVFRDVAEAYTVLTDSNRRSKFDMYGERGLKDGVLEEANYKGWQYVGNPMELFEKFFGETSASALMMQEFGGKFNLAPRALLGPDSKKATELELRLTLDELYRGATKSQRVERQRFSSNGQPYTDAKTLSLKIQPGWTPGTRLTFKGEGNQLHPNFTECADLIFTVTEAPHSRFERVMDTSDILYVHKCTLKEALVGHIVSITLLDESTLNLHVPETVNPGYEKRILEHGLQRADGSFGDLLIRWDISFPTLTSEQRAEVAKVLE